MDELPDLRSDADVDALMARLRARVAPSIPSPSSPAAVQETTGSSDDLAAAQEGLVATMIRAMQTIADALDDLETGHEPQQVQKTKPRPRTPTAPRRKA